MAVAPVAITMLIGAGLTAELEDTADAASGVGINAAAIPPLARQMLPVLQAALDRDCPDLPAVWVIAQVQAESNWNPRTYSPAGAAGLLQLLPASWVEAGGHGGAWPVHSTEPNSGPDAGHPVWEPATHLQVAVRWMCTHLQVVTAHLHASDKPLDPLDAMAVCHIAGCSRVTGSATGIPTPGQAGCGAACVEQITAYLSAIHGYVRLYSTAVPLAGPPGTAAVPYRGSATGCSVPDPSGTGGCVSGALAWLMAQVDARFGPWPVACWSYRGGNLRSDHPKGRACDYTVGRIGTRPSARDVTRGWGMASWLRGNATALYIDYVIWQGRIWSRARDADGWRPYGGGGMHDPASITGGHYDHVHVSTTD